jgi:hypothetical protein
MVAIAAAWATSAGATADADGGGSAGSDLEAASVAIPGTPGAAAQDDSTLYRHTALRSVRADAVATASTTCNGCGAQAATLQVVYARNARTLTADTVAAAWSTCTGCHAVALSLQIVVTRSPGIVTAANRALALNAACIGCSTRAAAIQIIVVSPSGRDLSFASRVRSEALRDQLLAQLRAQPSAQVAGPAGRVAGNAAVAAGNAPAVPAAIMTTTQEIQATVAADLAATSASHDIQLRIQ